MGHIVGMIEMGWDVVVTHGNGPELALSCAARISKPRSTRSTLDYCGADTQGAIGYMFQQILHNQFWQNLDKNAVTVVTQTI